MIVEEFDIVEQEIEVDVLGDGVEWQVMVVYVQCDEIEKECDGGGDGQFDEQCYLW